MTSVGFSAQSIPCFESYLVNRTFQVDVKNKFASVAYINWGVAQGSLSGPLLSPIYVNPFVPNAPFLYLLKTSENRKERVHWEQMG